MSKVDTSDLGPNASGSSKNTAQEGVNPEQRNNGVDEEHKIIEGGSGGGDNINSATGQARGEAELNLGQQVVDGVAQANGDGVGKGKGAYQLLGEDHLHHLTADCFARVEFEREQLQVKSKKGLCMAIKRQI